VQPEDVVVILLGEIELRGADDRSGEERPPSLAKMAKRMRLVKPEATVSVVLAPKFSVEWSASNDTSAVPA
jgi:hypothetical protein